MQMKPILVHIHAFYGDILPHLLESLRVLTPFPHEVWVTYPENDLKIPELLAGCVDSEKMLPVSNNGYDVLPFLKVLKKLNLDDYSYCIKLHTKRDMPLGSMLRNVDVGGNRWRESLMSFLQPAHFNSCMQSFATDATLGMAAHHLLIFKKEPIDYGAWEESIQMLNSRGIHLNECAFVAGTMFICRAHLLKLFLEVFGDVEFPPTRREDIITPAHVAERFLGHSVYAQGYKIYCPFTPRYQQTTFFDIVRRISRFFFLRKVTAKGKLIIKVCKIPVYSKKI